jgi:succinate dehydrogenase hydrophobic anchor subunit
MMACFLLVALVSTDIHLVAGMQVVVDASKNDLVNGVGKHSDQLMGVTAYG